MPRPVHFEISAEDPERALHFYREVFGWQSQKWDGPRDYWLLNTGTNDEPGIDGGLAPRHPGPPVVNTISGDSIDAHLAKIESQGGQITQAKMPIPGVGYLAYCQDTEGNPFGIMEMDETAD
jgi:predicted enzyme related to lactoylglutathione lyase